MTLATWFRHKRVCRATGAEPRARGDLDCAARARYPRLPRLVLLVVGSIWWFFHHGGTSFGQESLPSQTENAARIVDATDLDGDGDLDGGDIRLAFSRCDEDPEPESCVVALLPATYRDVQLVVPPGVSEIRGQGDATILVGRTESPIGPVLHRRPSQSGHATRFVSFRIDGAKQRLSISPGPRHNCIRIGDKTSKTLAGGLIEDITCESVAQEGFFLEDAPGWTIRRNRIRYIGCWDAHGTEQAPWRPNGIPSERMGCGPWGARQPDESNQPGRITTGVGIEITRNSDDVEIDSNLVQYFTKIGIQGISGRAAGPEAYPRDGRIAGNTVEWGLTGIALVRTRGWTVEDNVARDLAPPWMFGNVGKGYGCAHDGVGSRWLRNRAIRTGGVGFDIGCSCSPTEAGSGPRLCGIEFAANRSTDSCLLFGRGVGALEAQTGAAAPRGFRPSGIVIARSEVVRTRCDSAVKIRGFDDVRIDSASSNFEGGRRFGLHAVDAHRITVRAGSFRGQGAGKALEIEASSLAPRVEGLPSGVWGAPSAPR